MRFLFFMFISILSIALLGSEAKSFSKTHAESLLESPEMLKKYLDSHMSDRGTLSYYYIYYKQSKNYLSAIMTLTDIVNLTDSSKTVLVHKKEFETILRIAAAKYNDSGGSLFIESDSPTTLSMADRRFFATLNQIVNIFSKSGLPPREDAWIFWKTYTLLFSNIKSGVEWGGDEFSHRLWNRYIKMSQDESLLSYLGFFFFFIEGESSLLPGKDFYFSKLHNNINLIKNANSTENQSLANISTLMARFTIENISIIPDIKYVPWSEFKRLRAEYFRDSSEKRENCSYIENRSEMFLKLGKEFKETLEYNKAVFVIEGCDEKRNYPFLIKKNVIIIPIEEAFLTDVAITIHYTGEQNYSKSQMQSLLSGALLSSLNKYIEGGYESEFGKELLYAYYTNRINFLRDALFIYPVFSSKNLLSTDDIKNAALFIKQFYR